MEKTLATLPSNLPVPKKCQEYFDDRIEERRWELGINYKTKIYLTDGERDFFLNMISSGKKIIKVGELILTKRFEYLIPIRDKRENKNYQLVDGVMKEV
jgi:hypothetical protein